MANPSTPESSRKQSRSRAQTNTQIFPLAHPPPKKGTQQKRSRPRLRLSSRLLLQIQQSSSSRAIPILELFQPSTFGKSIVSNDGTARKVHSRDLYLTQSEMFTHLRGRRKRGSGSGNTDENGYLSVNGHANGNGTGTKPRSFSGASGGSASGASYRPKSRSSYGDATGSSGEEGCEWKAKFRPRKSKNKSKSRQSLSISSSAGDESSEEDEVVAVIHTSPKKSKTTTATTEQIDAELFFPITQQTWHATSTHQTYQFKPPDGQSDIIFTWESRPASPSSISSSSSPSATDRFVLSAVIDGHPTSSPKNAWLAQLTRQGFRIGGLEEPAIRALIRGCDGQQGEMGAGLYTLILTMGVWVARREEWVV
ncbi:hypothetical protein BDV18DRAFT_146199 [Aspergillus unguis]